MVAEERTEKHDETQHLQVYFHHYNFILSLSVKLCEDIY